jgi:hypothetical protein
MAIRFDSRFGIADCLVADDQSSHIKPHQVA